MKYMYKKGLSFFLALIMLFSIVSPALQVHAEEPGDGTDASYTPPAEDADGYYPLSTAEDMLWFANQVNTVDASINGKLTANITFTEDDGNWMPMGTSSVPFTGQFDGGTHKITSLASTSTTTYRGLFGRINGGTVKNLTLEDVNITGSGYVGGITGYVTGGTIQNCSVTGSVTSTGAQAGGIAGCSDTSTISDCTNRADITASQQSGGIVGYMGGAAIVNQCYNTGDVTGTATTTGSARSVGGIVGVASGTSIINKSCNTGTVKGNNVGVGGVAGGAMVNAQVIFSYSRGNVRGAGSSTSSYVGGIVGYAESTGMLWGCYSTGTVSAESSTGYIGLAVGYTTDDYIAGITNNYAVRTSSSTAIAYPATATEANAKIVTAETLKGPEVLTALNGGTSVFVADTDSINDGYPILRWQTGDDSFGNSTVARIYVLIEPTYTLYAIGETFDKTGMVVTATFVNGNTITLTADDFTVTPSPFEGGETYATISYAGDPSITTTVDVTMLSIQPPKQVDGYYQLSSPDAMLWFSNQVSALGNTGINGKLTADIDMSGVTWTPIGKSTSGYQYTGQFDGGGHTITGLTVSGTSYRGLFGYINGGTVKDLTLEEVAISVTSQYVGGIAGYVTGTAIENCHVVSGTMYSSYSSTAAGACANIGGLVGAMFNSSKISDCTNNATITGQTYIGGVVGRDNASTVTKCVNTGAVTGTKFNSMDSVGGVVGYMTGAAAGVEQCYNTGDVKGTGGSIPIGGIVGNVVSGRVISCYNHGNVSSIATNTNSRVGGIVGTLGTATVRGCYSTGLVTVDTTTVGYVGLAVGYAVDAQVAQITSNCCIASEGSTPTKTIGYTALATDANVKILTADELKSNVGLTDLNGDYRDFVADFEGAAGINGGYPILRWQTEDTTTFTGVTLGDENQKFYIIDDTFNKAGYYVWANYSDGTRERITDYTISKTTESGYMALADNQILISGTCNGQDYSFTIDITVIASSISQDEDGYYLLLTVEDMRWFADHVNNGHASVNGRLMADIDLSGVTWTPIGTSSAHFQGQFDGGSHKITDLTITATSGHRGLFGYISGGTVKDLNLENVAITASNNVGGIAGYVTGGTIENCAVTGNINSDGIAAASGSRVGGIAGYVTNGTIENCHFTGSVTGSNSSVTTSSVAYSGGIAGYVTNGTIENCHTGGSVTGIDTSSTDACAGGIVGYTYTSSQVNNCYSTSEVSATEYAGGICGSNYSSATIDNCVALNASLTGGTSAGRICGTTAGTMTNNYAWNNLPVNGSVITNGAADNRNGGNRSSKSLMTAEGWPEVFKNSPWSYTAGYLPTLTALDETPSEPLATRGITFGITLDSDAAVTINVWDSDGDEITETAGFYKLIVGEAYRYTVSADGYTSKEGILTVTADTGVIVLTLLSEAAEKKAITFEGVPESGTLVVKTDSGTPIDAEADGSYLLTVGGTYTYTVSGVFGYATTTKSFTVDNDTSQITVTLLPDVQTADYQGFGSAYQTALLCASTASSAAHENVFVLRTAASGTNEGSEYYLTRINPVYNINENVSIRVAFSAGMNAYTDALWKINGMRYVSVIDASTGEVVANWRDETPDASGKNSTGAYQMSYSGASGSVIYTTPKAALAPSHSYFIVLGSATCGNNNSKMLYVPVVYLFTTSDEDGGGSVDTSILELPFSNSIDVNVIKGSADTSSSIAFNRFNGSTYAAGSAITASVPGQEIAIKATSGEGLTCSFTVVGASGKTIPINGFSQGGPNSSSFGDTRFTMPNEKVMVNAVFGYPVHVTVTNSDSADITIKDDRYTYTAESDGSYVLPVGEYTYIISAESEEGNITQDGTFIVTTETSEILVTIEQAPDVPETAVVNFAVTPDNAVIVVKDGDENPITANTDESYTLVKGEAYSYIVSAGGYETKSGVFTVSDSSQTITIELEVYAAPTYGVTFSVTPSNAAVTVKSGDAIIQPGADRTYLLPDGDYSYSVSASGYETKIGTFTVSDSSQTITAELEISTAPTYEVAFSVTPSDATVAVKSGDTPVVAQADGSYLLPAGDYGYEVSAEGYVTKTGTFTVSDEAKEVTVELEALPASAYRLTVTTYPKRASVVIRDSGGNPVTAEPDGSYLLPDGNYTYEVSMLGYKTEIGNFNVGGEDVDLGLITLTADINWNKFTDVDASQWYKNAVEYSVANNLFSGISETLWEPDTSLTRAMFVTVLGKYEGVDISKYTTCEFGDVPDGEWYTVYTQWAFETGLVAGTGNGNFSPNVPITRQEMAVIFYKYVESKGVSVTVSDSAFKAFPDSSEADSWAVTALTWATGKHIMNGDNLGKLVPLGTASRSQAAQVFMVLIENIL